MGSLNDRLLPFQHKNSTRKHPASTSGKASSLSEFPFYELSDLKIKIIGWMGLWRGPIIVPPVSWVLNTNISSTVQQGIFNYITTGAFTPVSHLLAPVVKQYFQMSWAHFDHLIVKSHLCWKSRLMQLFQQGWLFTIKWSKGAGQANGLLG